MSEELKWFLSLDGRKAQIVGQAEGLPCLLARCIWSARMKNRAVLYCIDNDATRYGFIQGTSDDPHMAVMPASFWEEKRITPSFPWFARVPTVGNPADEPSRGATPCILCSKSGRPIHPVEREMDPFFESTLLAMWSDGVEFTPYGET